MRTDLRDAVRGLTRRPLFSLAVIGLLALGVGANTTVFSMVRAVLLRPLPFADADRLVYLWRASEARPTSRGIQTGRDLRRLRDGLGGLVDLAVLMSWQHNTEVQFDHNGPGGSERLRGMLATPNWFDLVGFRAALGRTFREGEETDGPVVVLSDAFWRQRLAADPDIVGRPFTVVGGYPRTAANYTIIGVLPPEYRFTYPQRTDIWIPLPWSAVADDGAVRYEVVGRLAADATLAAVGESGTAIYRAPAAGGGSSTRALFVETLPERLTRDVRSGVWLLSGVMALVLAIACVNAGLLVMMRALDRQQDTAIRLALGASRWQIVRRQLAEGLVLGSISGAVGVCSAFLTQPGLRALIPSSVARGDEAKLDLQVLGFAAAVTFLSILVCGLAPAVLARRRAIQQTVRHAGPTATVDRRGRMMRRLIVTGQVAVVTVLALTAGLLVRSFLRLQSVDLGFESHGLTMIELRLMSPKYLDQPDRVASFERELRGRLLALPGVEGVALSTSVPFQGRDTTVSLAGGVRMREVDPSYFGLLNIRPVTGRLFDARDVVDAPPVAVVSEALARKLFGDATPLGRPLEDEAGSPTVVGVVPDTRQAAVAQADAPAYYVPRNQGRRRSFATVVIRTARPGLVAAATLRRVVADVDPEQPVDRIATVDELIAANTAEPRFYTAVTTLVGVVALVLVGCGLYGAVSRTVTERRRELAIRVALGADRAHVFRMAFGFGAMPAAAGLLVGLAVAAGLSNLLRGFLFEITPQDGWTYVATAATVIGVAVAACLGPSRRAAVADPASALRE